MRYKIMQIAKDRDPDYEFMGYDFAKKHGFKLSDYECVWDETAEGKVDLEDIFNKFNIDRPEEFHGHSLSVSDLVVLDDVIWYCDNIGWEKVGWFGKN